MTETAHLGTWNGDLKTFGQRLRARLAPGQGERPGRPSDPTWTLQRKLSMSQVTLEKLEQLAEALSSHDRRVSPMQVAALLVEDAAQAALENAE